MSEQMVICNGKVNVKDYKQFRAEWLSVCLRLKCTGVDLSKIKLKKGAK